jgi:hypothetical protein
MNCIPPRGYPNDVLKEEQFLIGIRELSYWAFITSNNFILLRANFFPRRDIGTQSRTGMDPSLYRFSCVQARKPVIKARHYSRGITFGDAR